MMSGVMNPMTPQQSRSQVVDAARQVVATLGLEVVEAWFWHGFCDIYIELAKHSLRDPKRRAATQWTLWKVLDGMMRLMPPVIPFITEEIWQRLPHLPDAGPLLMTQDWATEDKHLHDSQTVGMMSNMIVPLIENVRTLKHEQAMDAKEPVRVSVKPMGDPERYWLNQVLHDGGQYIKALCGADLTILAPHDDPPKPNLSTVFPLGTIYLAIPAPANPEAERKRLGKERDDLEKLLKKTKGQLANKEYVAKAPPELVEESRKKAADYAARLGRLSERLKQLG